MKHKRKPAKPRRLREIERRMPLWDGYDYAYGNIAQYVKDIRYLLDYIAKLEGRRK